MTTMLKLLRNICIWMCSTSCLFGYVTHAVPLEYFDDHEFSYDMDTAQSKVKYDPRLLSQQLKDQHNHPQERAAPCYSATNKYTHGQRVSREDPCEVCLCVDGEIFCWWKKCGSPKRRKFKLEKNTKLGKSKKDKTTIDRINKEQLHKEQLHLKQKKQLEKKLKQQHWQEQQHQLQHTGARSKILTFPENLPSVLYYDYKTEDQHGFQHGNHEKPPASPADGSGVGGRTNAHTSISGSSREDDDNNDDDNNGGEDDDDASSAVGVVQPTSAEMKFGAKSHSATEANKKYSLQQTSTARITTTTTTTTTKAAVAAEAAALQPFPNDYTKEDGLNANNQFISGHPVGGMQMLNIDGSRHHTTEQTKNHTTTQGETTFMLSQSQEVDHDDGILRGTGGGNGGSVSTHGSKYSTLHNSDNNKQNNEQLKGGATSFRSSFNDFSSEFNASAAVDLDLIIGHHSAHDAPIILEADSIANASSSSLLAKHETGDSASSANTNNNSNRYNLVLSTTMVTSTTVNQDQECIVMGSSYKIGAILPQETGNCLQCICIEGATKDDTPRVTCSPHNCPPLVLPDLFDATGY